MKKRFWLIALFCLAFAVVTRAQTPVPSELAAAMDIPGDSIQSATFAKLASNSSARAVSNWGLFSVQAGTTMIALSTGIAADSDDPGFVSPKPGTQFSNSSSPVYGTFQDRCEGTFTDGNTVFDVTELVLSLNVPTNVSAFRFRHNFLTAEYSGGLCTLFNDRFVCLLSSQQFNGNIAYDAVSRPISAFSYFPLTTSNALAGTGMDLVGGAATGWLTTTAPVTPGETITLRFVIFDQKDRATDSQVLLDGFTWIHTMNATGIAFQANEGELFSGDVATFTDGNPSATLSNYTATIFWGDGEETAGTIRTNAAGGFIVSGSHLYVQPGPYFVQTGVSGVNNSTVVSAWAIVRPKLRMELVGTNSVQLRWSSPSTGFQLESTTEITATNWNLEGEDHTIVAGEKVVSRPVAEARRFYRLRSP